MPFARSEHPRHAARSAAILATAAVLAVVATAPLQAAGPAVNSFVPIATYAVSGEVAEIVASTPDGRTLVYTDLAEAEIGFVDITDPGDPVEAAAPLGLEGSPTAVAITTDGHWALVAVDTSASFTDPTGELVVVDLANGVAMRTIQLGGQPDSIAVSGDGRHAAIILENQRDEDVADGDLPQLPSGGLTILDLVGSPAAWTTRTVDLAGLPDAVEPTDAEPEFVDIDRSNRAAITLQENNAVAIVDLPSGTVIDSWSAGSATHAADLDDDDVIDFSDSLTEAREPDAIGWTPDGNLVTANEGDWLGGSRDFTIFAPDGTVIFTSGVSLEQHVAAGGRYDDGRSDNKGVEPEGVEVGTFGSKTYLFIGAERAATVAVYRLGKDRSPTFVQLLATGDRPEGLLAIPDRGLFVTANEGDGTISIFAGRPAAAAAPVAGGQSAG